MVASPDTVKLFHTLLLIHRACYVVLCCAVSRFVCRSELYEFDLTIDINIDIYPLKVGDWLALPLQQRMQQLHLVAGCSWMCQVVRPHKVCHAVGTLAAVQASRYCQLDQPRLSCQMLLVASRSRPGMLRHHTCCTELCSAALCLAGW